MIQSLLLTILIANLFAVFLTHYFGANILYLSIKDIVLVLLLLIHLPFLNRKKSSFLIVFLPIALLLGLHLIIGNEPILSRVASLRQLSIPFGLLTLGFLMVNIFRKQDLQSWFRSAIYLLLFGSIVMYAVFLLELLPIQSYADLKQLALTDNNIPFMFYDGISGNLIRNVSTFLDPINLGHFLAFSLIYFWYEKKSSLLFLALILVALVLTISKGAFLQLVLCIFILERHLFPRWFFYGGLLCIIPLLCWASIYHGGIAAHLHGLKVACTHLTFLGEGLGAVGNQALLFKGETSLAIFDTYIGSVVGQIGLLGLAIWLLPFCILLLKLKKYNWLQVLLITQLAVAAISENTFNFLSIFPLMLCIGFYSNKEDV